jgi:hypothetical protein
MNPSDFFAAVEHKAVAESPLLSAIYFLDVPNCTPEDAARIKSRNAPKTKRVSTATVEFDNAPVYDAMREQGVTMLGMERMTGYSDSLVGRYIKDGRGSRRVVTRICSVLGLDTESVIA